MTVRGVSADGAVIVGQASVETNNKTVTVDHPFLLFIRDVPTGAILFSGGIVDPTH